MRPRIRRALRTIPGYQFARQHYRKFTEKDFRERAKLQNWITTGMRIQDDLQLEPIVFREGRAFIQSRDGIEYWWHPGVQGCGLGLEFGSDFEREELDCLFSYLLKAPDEAPVVLDIGGNCGLYSLNVARRFPKACVHCFEPVPGSQEMIRVNAEQNGVAHQITLVGKALGNESGTVRMTASYSAMDHLVVGDSQDELSPLIIDVPMTTLDTYMSEGDLRRVDFIKCDVEGAEILVFKGAREVLARFHPPILVEIEPRHTERFNYAPADLDTFFRSFGYIPCLPIAAPAMRELASIQEGIDRGNNNFLYLQQAPN